MKELEAQYNNRARVPEHPRLLAGYAEDAARFRTEAQASGIAELGLRYGDSARQIVDLFTPRRVDASACLAMFIHGGYWQGLEPAMFSHMARGALAHGVPMALIGYDLAPQVTLTEIVDQVRRACLFVAGRTDRRLAVSGHSAGGHLTACMAATDWQAFGAREGLVAAGLAISGVFDLPPLLQTSINDKLRLTLDEAGRLSPMRWTPLGVPIDAWVGGDESEEFIRQSRELAETWSRAGADATCRIVEGANHFTVIHPLADPASPMTARLVALCRGGG